MGLLGVVGYEPTTPFCSWDAREFAANVAWLVIAVGAGALTTQTASPTFDAGLHAAHTFDACDGFIACIAASPKNVGGACQRVSVVLAFVREGGWGWIVRARWGESGKVAEWQSGEVGWF
jgi:hypothetical protein